MTRSLTDLPSRSLENDFLLPIIQNFSLTFIILRPFPHVFASYTMKIMKKQLQ